MRIPTRRRAAEPLAYVDQAARAAADPEHAETPWEEVCRRLAACESGVSVLRTEVFHPAAHERDSRG